MNLKNKFSRAVALCAALTLPAISMAEPTFSWSQLTDDMDFGDLSIALLAAGGSLLGVYIVMRGVRMVLSFVRS